MRIFVCSLCAASDFDKKRYEIPAEFPEMVREFSKCVIFYNPPDIPAFGRDYFAAIADNNLDAFLDAMYASSKDAQTKSAPGSDTKQA